MELRNIQFYITYAFLFSCVFFVGFDNQSLFLTMFPRANTINLTGIISFLSVSLGGLVIGLLMFRRLIKKQPLDFILKISLLFSGFFSWLQFYLPSILDFSSMHIQTITVFLTNISMGLFLYCSQTILKEKGKIKKNLLTFLLWVFFILGILVIENNFNLMNSSQAILSSITYIIGFVCVMTLKGNDFMEIKHSNPYSHVGILIGIVYLTLCYLISSVEIINNLEFLFNNHFTFIGFASLLFWLKPSVNKASVVLFLIFSQIFN